jgi:molybdate transport system ATP-binding protein
MTLAVSLKHRAGAFSLGVDFEIERPGVTALFGASGAGKSTVVNAIAGLLRPQAGSIVIDGETVLDTETRVFVPARLRRMGYVFQDARLFPHLSVESNLRFGWRRARPRVANAQFDEIVEILGLAPLLARRPAGLSGGEKSRVALGRALLASPRLLLLDEPLASLDAPRKREILPYLERLRDLERLPMIYVTHSTDEVARLADGMVVLQNGRVVAQGSVFDLLSDPELGALVPSHGAVFRARLASHRADGLTTLAFDGGSLFVPRLARPPGTLLRVRLRADDIMLAREAPRDISANNVLAAEILSVHAGNPDQAEIRLRCGSVKLVSHITRASRERLALAPGQQVFAIVKAVTVDPQLDAPGAPD